MHSAPETGDGDKINIPTKVVFLKALNGELEQEPLMKFRLTYEGELRPSQRDPFDHQKNKLAEHKHEIRRCFHKQLKHMWTVNNFLREYKRHPKSSIDSRPIHISGAYFDHPDAEKVPLVEYIASRFRENNYRYVPLVCEEFSLACSLEILFLRRDPPGSAIQAGDIDNRIKTLIDALKKPRSANELTGNEQPRDGEDPFFCLLEDDNLISHFAVETDTLLDEIQLGDADKRKAHVIITVELRPLLPTYFNLAFS